MPGTSFQDIITTHPNFMDPAPSEELTRFTELCEARVRSCEGEMSQEEIDALCYIFCSVSNFAAFDKLVKVVMGRWAKIGITTEVYNFIIKSNIELVSSDTNRIMHPYGLVPTTPNLVNKVIMLGREGYSSNQVTDPDIVGEIFSALRHKDTEAEKKVLETLERQLWDGPITSIKLNELLAICTEPKLLWRFLDNKRNEGNQQTSYISRIFQRLLLAEEYFPMTRQGVTETANLLNLMDILFNAIDQLSFQSQEIALTDLFIEYNALLLLQWLEQVVSDKQQKQKLQEKIAEIHQDLDEEADFSEVQGSGLDSAMDSAEFSSSDPKLDQLFEILGRNGYSREQVLMMDEDLLSSILFSLGVASGVKPPEQQRNFGLKWITRKWHDAEFIDRYLLNSRDALAAKGFGLMPSITELETLDPEYLRAVVQGEKGILRSTNISHGDFSSDAPREFRQLLWPTCTGQSHFGLLVLHFDEAGTVEGGFYFEPKEDFGLQNLNEILKNLGNPNTIQISMGQSEDDFCGDYVITVALWFAHILNPRIISWSEYKKTPDTENAKIQADPNYSQLLGGRIPMDQVECLRCDMAIKLGREFVNYLNLDHASEISESDWQTTVLPAIEKRHAELSALEQAEEMSKQSETASQSILEQTVYTVPSTNGAELARPLKLTDTGYSFFPPGFPDGYDVTSLGSAADVFLEGYFSLEKPPSN